jgi:hypothetical protein
MIANLFTLLFMIFAAAASACEVDLPERLVVIGDAPDLTAVMAQKGCSPETLRELSATLRSVNGKITKFHFAELLRAKNVTAELRRPLVSVENIRHLVREQLPVPGRVQLLSATAVNHPDYLVLGEGERLELRCEGCAYGTGETLNLFVNAPDGSWRGYLVTANFRRLVKAYRVTEFRQAFGTLSPEVLREEQVEAIPHTDLLTDLSLLRFYKLNKPLKAGELVRLSDLTALDLVKAGLRTEVVIENSLIRLKTAGISRSNGALGDLVEVYHPQKNKKYQGKVIDINKVLVEL